MPSPVPITENIIESVIERLGEDENYFQYSIQNLLEAQPQIGAYIFSEDFKFFTQEEKEHLIFMTIVINNSVMQTGIDPMEASQEEIGSAEEKNWEIIQAERSKEFRTKLDPFYKNHKQEDLIAFVEDLLNTGEEDNISKEARDHLFIAGKTIIDVLT